MKDIFDIEHFVIDEPGPVLRWGTLAVFVFFLIFLLAASSFGYHEIAKGEVIVTSENPPVLIRAKREGRISGINYKTGEVVGQGAVLAILENTANQHDVAFLKLNLQSQNLNPASIAELNQNFPAGLRLGSSIQPYYSVLLNLYQQEILDGSLRNEVILQEQLSDQIRNQKMAIQNKEAEIFIAKQGLYLVQSNLQRHQDLHSKGVISKLDLEKIEREVFMDQSQYQLLEQQLNELVLTGKGMEQKQLLSKNIDFRRTSLQKTELILARQDLLNAIAQWEETYLLTSPIAGRVVYFDVWGTFQNIRPGEDIFTIIPFGKQKLIGKCSLPIHNSGKLRVGQTVVIKLDNYPFREWGTLRATVEAISGISRMGKEPGYVVYLRIDNLVTSYGKRLEFDHELLGTAEILLDEATVLGRIFNEFRYVWSGRNV